MHPWCCHDKFQHRSQTLRSWQKPFNSPSENLTNEQQTQSQKVRSALIPRKAASCTAPAPNNYHMTFERSIYPPGLASSRSLGVDHCLQYATRSILIFRGALGERIAVPKPKHNFGSFLVLIFHCAGVSFEPSKDWSTVHRFRSSTILHI